MKEIMRINPTGGGPLIKDRLWIYGGFRSLINEHYDANSYNTIQTRARSNTVATQWVHVWRALVPDSRKPGPAGLRPATPSTIGYREPDLADGSQEQVQLLLPSDAEKSINDSSVTSPEASSYLYSDPDYIAQVSWVNPAPQVPARRRRSFSPTRRGGGCKRAGIEPTN